MTASKYKVGDKVTVIGVGIAYIRDILSDGYYIYIVNRKATGGGWHDHDFVPGWVKVDDYVNA